MHHLGQSVDKNGYGSLAFRFWQICHQIGGDLLPSSLR